MTRARLSPLFTWRSAIVDSDLPSTTKLAALCLSLHMNERGGSCFPSLETLAKESSLGVSSIKRSLKLLDERGWLLRKPGGRADKPGGRGRTTAYTATIPADTTPPGDDEQLDGPEDPPEGVFVPKPAHTEPVHSGPVVSGTGPLRSETGPHVPANRPSVGQEDVMRSSTEDVKTERHHASSTATPTTRPAPAVSHAGTADTADALVDYFAEQIQSRTGHRPRIVDSTWTGPMFGLTTMDRRSPAELRELIDFALADPFWARTITNPAKLRRNLDSLTSQLAEQRRRRPQRPDGRPQMGAYDPMPWTG